MFTITPRTRTREGVSWEDDRCTTGYEIIDSDGKIIYDFADEDTKNWYEELNKKEEENTMKTTFKTIEKNINAIRRDYGEMIFRMSISHLMDVGMRNLTPELVNEAKDEIMKQDDGKMFVTNEVLCDVVECAGELAKINAIDLLVYIGKNVAYDVDGYCVENEEGDED